MVKLIIRKIIGIIGSNQDWEFANLTKIAQFEEQP